MQRWYFKFYCLAPASTLVEFCIPALSRDDAAAQVKKEFKPDWDKNELRVIKECEGCECCDEGI